MSADQYRRDARNYLDRAYAADLEYATNLGVMANTSALLAIEARLGELVDVLREAHKPAVVEVGPFAVHADGDPAEVADAIARARKACDEQTVGGGL